MPINGNTNQADEWQVQVSKRKKNNQRKQKKGQRYSSKEQVVNKNKRDNAYYYQTTKKNKDQNGNKNKNGKRSNKYDNKVKKQNKGRDILLESIPIDRNKNLNIIKSTSLLKLQFERQQNSQKDISIDLKSKNMIPDSKKAMSEISDMTAVSVTSLASDTNSATSSTLTQTNSLIKENIEESRSKEILDKKCISKTELSEETLLNKENECTPTGKNNKINSSFKKIASPTSVSVSPKSTSSIIVNTITTNGIISHMKDNLDEKNVKVPEKDELIRKLENECSFSSTSSVTSFNSDASTSKSSAHSSDDSESVITAKNETDDLKMTETKKDTDEIKKTSDEKCEKVIKEEEKKNNSKEDMTKKVLEFNFKDYTDVKPFIPKHLKVKQEQSKVETVAPKPQNLKHHAKGNNEKKHENESGPIRKPKEINKIIRIDPSCLHQKDGHIIPIPAVINMKNVKNHGNSVQEILQRNIQQKTNEYQESKKKKFEELRKSLDHSDKGCNNSQEYQSLPIQNNLKENNHHSETNAVKKSDEKISVKEDVEKTMSNSTSETSTLNDKKESQKTSSYTMSHINMMQKNIPNLVDYGDDYMCHSVSQLAVSNRIENEYNNVKCYNDPMEQSLNRVKPASLKKTTSVQSISTSLLRKGSNHQLLLGGDYMTITNTITTCKSAPRLHTSKSVSWLKGSTTGLNHTHVTTYNTTTTTSHSGTLYTNLIGSSTYYPIVVLPTAGIQELSVETTTRNMKNTTGLTNIMGKLFRKFTWPFGGNNVETQAPLSIETK